MFIGHYGIGYMVKEKEERIPLWLLFTSVQLLDIIAFTLVLFGVENASFAPNNNPFYRNQLSLPYSHSLSGAIIISFLVFLFFWISGKRKWAWITGLCVLSHWLIDLLVHTNDLSLWFGSFTAGIGLWEFPNFTFVIEILLLVIGWLFLQHKNIFSYLILFLMVASFSGMTFGEEPDVLKHNDYLRTSVVLLSNGLFIFLAFLYDRKEFNRTISNPA